MNEKLCPLRITKEVEEIRNGESGEFPTGVTTEETTFEPCLKEKCAWWIENMQEEWSKCAIRSIALSSEAICSRNI